MATNATANGSANGTEVYQPKFTVDDIDDLIAHGWKYISKDVFPYYTSMHATPVASDRSKSAAAPADRHKKDGDATIVPYDNYRFHYPKFREEMEKRGITMFCSNMTLELNDAEQTNLNTFGTQVPLGVLRIKATDNPLEIWKNIPESFWDTVFKTFMTRRNNEKETCTENMLWRLMACRPCIKIGHYTLVSPDITEVQIFGVKFEPKHVPAVRAAMKEGTPSRVERKRREERMKREYGIAATLRQPLPPAPAESAPKVQPTADMNELSETLTGFAKSVREHRDYLAAACAQLDELTETVAEAKALKDELSKLVAALRPPRPRATSQDCLGPSISANGELVPMTQVPTTQETNHPAFVQTGGAR